MLKALELVGFKSFADKTRLEFQRGITVVVGPNGSGKSNIVDAIKWVLGEQSVKSLRGKEMADVIFNGSSNRRPLHSAETTLVFDNSQSLLAVDTPEVHVTRRVYRSGEGEYLINRQSCRLKDIRDLFAGTGIATEAYSVIEQGKVDVLLQSSPRERRLIFEEAAGISRFKAKKIEAQRRLERVDQNLLRLSDIVDEVENRLRTVRSQAAKARKYQEHANRLQQLRTQVGLADWRQFTAKLTTLEAEVASARDEIAGLTAQAEAQEAEVLSLEVAIAGSEEAVRGSESRIARNRELIAAAETTIDQERRRGRDLDEELVRNRRQINSMTIRAGDLEHHLHETSEDLQQVESRHVEATQGLGTHERQLTEVTTQLDKLRAEIEQRRTAHLDTLRQSALLGQRISGLESKVAATEGASTQHESRLTTLQSSRQTLIAEIQPLRRRSDELNAKVSQQQAESKLVESKLAESRRQHTDALAALSQLQHQAIAASERISLLEELEKRLEGVSSGVKSVIARSKQVDAGVYANVRGMLADLLHVSVEHAPLIELALGELAHYVVVGNSDAVIDHLQQDVSLAGRVGMIRLEPRGVPAVKDIQLDSEPGVVGRADRLVETTAEYTEVVGRLLGTTWIVKTLADALRLHEKAGPGVSFIAQSGELVAGNGTLTLGPRQASTGLISRRSELRTLRSQVGELQQRTADQDRQCTKLAADIARLERDLQQSHELVRQAQEELAEYRLELGTAEQRLNLLDKQLATVQADLQDAKLQHSQATQRLDESRSELVKLESTLAEIETRNQQAIGKSQDLEAVRQRQLRETEGIKVELARIEQQLENLRTRRGLLERDQLERGRTLAEARNQFTATEQRLRQSKQAILRAESEIAELYLRKEALAGETVRLLNQRESHRQDRGQLVQEAQRTRQRIRKVESRLHAKDLAAGEVRHERQALADRLREDYGIDLDALEHEPTQQELREREAVDREIADLRAKINSIGGVNLDALAELEELEGRYNSLSSQYQDLSSAKNSLEQIISRINADSRKLFAETLEQVREHFQMLFRKLFGGGQADIVLEEGVDVLDSGIEIVARPPGKEPRSISLLSGGEKTLTCVALLLAIFRSRPSPFCVLDEVDAALDEANIDRFIAVVKEFMAWTQFIIVTHSKKTMTCADTLYGITMQESGVSKRVSVRFEDVSEDGHITRIRDEPADGETAAA